MNSWFRRSPSPEKIAVDTAVQALDEERAKRKSMVEKLRKALDEIPLDDGLVVIGNDMAKNPKGKH